MSEPKWTPGPWRYGEVSPYQDDPREISVMATNPRDGSPYCVAVAIPCGAGKLYRDLAPEMTEANARLIAAAPDLDNSCGALLGLIELLLNRRDLTPDLRDVLTTNHRIDEAKAARAKARGEET